MGNNAAKPDKQDVNTNPYNRYTATNGANKTKLYMTKPGYINKSFNESMQMNIDTANIALESLKKQYKNNPSATNEIVHALSELDKIKALPVNNAEKKRRVFRLAQLQTKLAENERIKQTPGGVALEGVKTVASATGSALGFIASILLGAARGSGPGGVYSSTHGPGAARIGGTKKRRLTKKR